MADFANLRINDDTFDRIKTVQRGLSCFSVFLATLTLLLALVDMVVTNLEGIKVVSTTAKTITVTVTSAVTLLIQFINGILTIPSTQKYSALCGKLEQRNEDMVALQAAPGFQAAGLPAADLQAADLQAAGLTTAVDIVRESKLRIHMGEDFRYNFYKWVQCQCRA